MPSLLKATSLSKCYPEGGKEIPVLSDINFEVDQGEVLSITGPSGAGKSTLLHILGTIEVPSAGYVYFQGEDLFRYSEERLSRFRNEKLGFVFQFHHLLAEFSALENVMMPLLLRGEPSIQRHEKAVRALKDVQLDNKASSLPGELSGGEQQRVAVARSIVTDPMILLADEPTGNLDRQTGGRLMDLLFWLNEERGVTLLYVTHNESLAARAKRTLQLRDGKMQ